MEGGGRSDPAAWGELSRAALPTLQRSRHEAGARGAPLAPKLIYGECRASIRLQCNGKVNIYDTVMLMTKETKQPNKLFQSTALTQISPPATGPVQQLRWEAAGFIPRGGITPKKFFFLEFAQPTQGTRLLQVEPKHSAGTQVVLVLFLKATHRPL